MLRTHKGIRVLAFAGLALMLSAASAETLKLTQRPIPSRRYRLGCR